MTNSETPANPTTKTVETRISQVTVYTEQARVTRRGIVMLTGEEKELMIAGVPFTMQPESIRVGGVGTVAVRLLSVRIESTYATKPVEEKVAHLTQQIEELKAQKRTILDRIQALQLQRNFVKSLGEKSSACFSRSLAQQQITLTETGELLNFIGRQYAKLSVAIAREEKQQQELDKQLEALNKQLQDVQTPNFKNSWKILIAIAPAGSGSFELEVSYAVNFASWQPLYDLHASGNKEELNLTYLAEVKQNTGEDWQDVALTLSTAKPGLGTLPPQLEPWYIDANLPRFPSPVMRQVEVSGQKKAEESDEEIFNSFTAAASNLPAPTIVAEISASVASEGGVVTFEVGGNNNIPSDNNPHKITIFSENYQGRLEYIAIPRLVSFAYLQTIVTNPAVGVTLLPGKVNIFRDNIFVGIAEIENVAPGQEFKINLGIDEGLKIERKLVERNVYKKMISGERRLSCAYRIEVTNLREREVTLKLIEQIPVSRNEQIKVRLTQINPKIITGEMGVLEWILSLPPQGKQEVYYQFFVEHPPTLEVVGLNI